MEGVEGGLDGGIGGWGNWLSGGLFWSGGLNDIAGGGVGGRGAGGDCWGIEV